MTESGLPRDGAMLTLLINVLHIGHCSLSSFEGTVSPVRRSAVEESLLDLDPMGRQRPSRLVCGVHVVFRLAVSPSQSECLLPSGQTRKVLPCWLGPDRERNSASETSVVEVCCDCCCKLECRSSLLTTVGFACKESGCGLLQQRTVTSASRSTVSRTPICFSEGSLHHSQYFPKKTVSITITSCPISKSKQSHHRP